MKKIFTFLFAALMSVGMFATTYTVTFTNLNNVVKVVENITLPHTFSCDYTNGNGELDMIIQESYNDTGHCDSSRSPWGGTDNEVVVGQDGNNHFLTINAPFVGTSFLSGYYEGTNFGTFYYSFHITIAASESEPQMDKTAIYVAYPAENHPAEIEIAFVNRDFTWGMEALDNKPWYASELDLTTSAEDTIKFRDKANNAKILCEYIPANGDQDGRWQQMYLKMANYEVVSFKGEMVRLIEELDLRDAAKYAWMENAPEPFPEGIENTNLKSEIKNHKLIKDGMIYIVRDGKIYNVQGVEVK